MPERCHLANKYEDIVNLQGRRHIVAGARLHVFYADVSAKFQLMILVDQ